MSETLEPLVDYHCHLDLYPDCEQVFRECAAENVQTFAVTTTPRAWEGNRRLAGNQGAVRVGLGMHPQLVSERGAEMVLFERLLPEAKFVGEVGLDASPRFYRGFEDQRKAFARVLELCNEQGGKIISIHSIRSAAQVLRMLEEHLDPQRGSVVLHWFTGRVSEASSAVRRGCYFSINSQMAGTAGGKRLIADLPLNLILTETDGPFALVAGRPSHPRNVERTIRQISEIRGMTAADIRRSIFANMRLLEEGGL